MSEISQQALLSAAEAVMAQAEEANGEYGIPVSPDVADFLGVSAAEDITGHED
ncbi:hypothetical protein LJB93_02030 [Desulfovibrio sp. OttesenSCG-928-F07]|nr:hypothetical protein [Desulfovibrio sp. OttesenSCG-928-F07]